MSFTIRDATADDVEALAQLHVQTFRETHGGGPPVQLREGQWREILTAPKAGWFCLLIQREGGQLVGFARGVPYTGDLAGFDGELNKLYLLREVQRQGLGRRLMGHGARRFLSHGSRSMLLFGNARSPSNGFYERLGGVRLLTARGEFHGGYGWQDLDGLAAQCPPE